MDKDNEIKGEWRAGIYDYGMFVENMRKLDSMRKKRTDPERFAEAVAAALGIFSSFPVMLVAALNCKAENIEGFSRALICFCAFFLPYIIVQAIVLGFFQVFPEKIQDCPERAWLIPCGKTEEWCVCAVKILRLVKLKRNRQKIYNALLRSGSLPENIWEVEGITEDDVRTECILAHLGFPVELDLRKGAAV